LGDKNAIGLNNRGRNTIAPYKKGAWANLNGQRVTSTILNSKQYRIETYEILSSIAFLKETIHQA
jgi:hypothetical protein